MPHPFPAPKPPPVPDPFPGQGKPPFLIPPPDEPPGPAVPTFSGAGGAMKYPARLSRTESGWLLVSDVRRKAILRVDPDTLQADQSLRIRGTPLAVGMLGHELFVGVSDRHAIEIYSPTGRHLGYLAEPGQIGFPGDLAIDADAGLVLVIDGTAKHVKLYRAADRTLLGTIGDGELVLPTGVAVDVLNRQVLVSDYGSESVAAAVKVFSYAEGSAGELVNTISGAGTCNFWGCRGGFSRPRGLAVRNGLVYFADVIHGQVLIYDAVTQEQVGVLGSGDPAVNDLNIPSDVEINAAGDVLVTSAKTGAVVAFLGEAP